MSFWNQTQYTNPVWEFGKKRPPQPGHRNHKFLHWQVRNILDLQKKVIKRQTLSMKEKELLIFLGERGISLIGPQSSFSPKTILRKNPNPKEEKELKKGWDRSNDANPEFTMSPDHQI